MPNQAARTSILPLLVVLGSAGNSLGIEYGDLQRVSSEAVRRRSVAIEAPRLEIHDGVLYFDKGSVWCGSFGKNSSFAYEQILNAQLHVEVIRQYRWRPDQRRFWAPYLKRCEAHIESALIAFNLAMTDKQRRQAQMQANAYRRILDEAIESYAAQSNLAMAAKDGAAAAQKSWYERKPESPAEMLVHVIGQFEDAQATREAETLYVAFQTASSTRQKQSAESRLWQLYGRIEATAVLRDTLISRHHRQKEWGVELRTAPDGAKIWLMPAIEARLAAVEGRRPQWSVVTQTDHLSLEGEYFYYLKWPSGETSGPARTRITGERVTLR